MRLPLSVPAAIVLLAAASSPAVAEDFCSGLDIPEQLDLICRVDAEGATVVQSPDSPFPGLNRIRLHRLDESVDEPASWLRAQMSVDTSSVSESLRGWMTHPDNPLKPEVTRPALEALTDALGELEQLSRTGCEDPRELREQRWVMRCDYELALASGVVRLELREPDADRPVAIEMRAASEQRVRQFEALLNGFRLEG